MAGIVLATGALPPLEDPLDLRGATSTWTGADGSVWALSDPRSPVRLKRGVRGLHTPPVTHQVKSAAIAPGATWEDFRVGPREVFWPLGVYESPGQAWLDLDSAFWSTLHPGRLGTWSVKQPGGQVRSLRCRALSDGSHAYAAGSPARLGWATYGVRLVAHDPFWQGAPVTRSWSAQEAEPFVPPGGGPPFHIGSSHTTESARVTNPGDVDAWPTWTVVGPFPSVELGIGGDVIEVPFEIGDGEVLTIDSDPWGPTATLDGDDVTGLVSDLGLAPIPPGADVALTLAAEGAGRVGISFVPNYLRAW